MISVSRMELPRAGCNHILFITSARTRSLRGLLVMKRIENSVGMRVPD